MSAGQEWRGWAIPLPGGNVNLNREAAAAVLFLVRWYLTTTAPRNGRSADVSGSSLLLEVRSACAVATREMSANGRLVRTSVPIPALSPRPDDLLTMTLVAEELNVSDRQARRLAHAGRLGAVTLVGRAKQVRRFEVDAYRTRGNR